MNKKIICAVIAVVLLAACTGKSDDKGKTDVTDSGSAVTTVTGSVNESKEDSSYNKGNDPDTPTVTIPPIPESGIPEIPDAEVIYSDTEVVIEVDPDGTSYANGTPIPADTAASIIVQQMKPEKETTTIKDDPAVPETTEITTEGEVIPPYITVPEQTTRPQGTIIVDDKNEGDIFYLGKYVSTGNTELGIKKIEVYTSSKPGVEGVDSLKPGDTVVVNLWCNSAASSDSVMYIIHESVKHDSSYAKDYVLLECDMSLGFAMSDEHLVFDFTLPDKVSSSVYELRFVCGTEEGYIPFHIG